MIQYLYHQALRLFFPEPYPHLSDEELAAFLQHDQSPHQEQRFAHHLDECDDCRERVERSVEPLDLEEHLIG